MSVIKKYELKKAKKCKKTDEKSSKKKKLSSYILWANCILSIYNNFMLIILRRSKANDNFSKKKIAYTLPIVLNCDQLNLNIGCAVIKILGSFYKTRFMSGNSPSLM